MSNLFAQFKSLLPARPLQAGTVQAVAAGLATIQLPDGGELQARGEASVGDVVFVRDGVIEGPAPDLTPVSITV